MTSIPHYKDSPQIRQWGQALFQLLHGSWLPGVVALSLLLLVYAGTLQWDINGSSNGYMVDVGEIQVALNVWGTIHYTGYPLFTILSALLVNVGRVIGMPPAGAASAAATVWSLLGLAFVYRILLRLTQGERGLAALLILMLGLTETFWVHSVVAEVYSFSLFLMSLSVLLALRLADHWCGRDWLLMIAILGAGVAHHRLLVLLLPSMTIFTAPVLLRHFPRKPMWLLGSTLAFLFPFLFYLYIPLRAIQHAFWVYGQPDTWRGFWAQFLGREETSHLLKIPADRHNWLTNFQFVREHLEHQLPTAVLLAGILGLIVLTRYQLSKGAPLLLATSAFIGFVFVFPKAVWAQAALMPGLFLLVLGSAYLIRCFITRWSAVRWMAGVGLFLISLTMFRVNLPFVLSLVRDPLGRDTIRTLSPLKKAALPGGRNVVALPWGGYFFATAYGLYVTGELDSFDLVDHRADFRSIVNREGKILTLASHLGYWPLNWWIDLLGEAHYSSAAPGVAVISRDALYQNVPLQVDFDLSNGVQVRSAGLSWEDTNRLWVTIYWETTQVVELDYRVAVHLVSKDPPEKAQDVLAQADAFNPVSGWYPVNLWSINEIVRDDYVLDVPPETLPVAVRIGMYRTDQEGKFINTRWLSLEIP